MDEAATAEAQRIARMISGVVTGEEPTREIAVGAIAYSLATLLAAMADDRQTLREYLDMVDKFVARHAHNAFRAINEGQPDPTTLQ